VKRIARKNAWLVDFPRKGEQANRWKFAARKSGLAASYPVWLSRRDGYQFMDDRGAPLTWLRRLKDLPPDWCVLYSLTCTNTQLSDLLI
jgi:hypothetical protein